MGEIRLTSSRLPLGIIGVLAAARAWSPGGFPNQLGATPLLGWRAWQAYGPDINQSLMIRAMNGLAKKRKPWGKSLADVGYRDVGLDSHFETHEGVNGSCHGPDKHMLVNFSSFPSLTAMNAHAHLLNLTTSWYLAGDDCPGPKEPFVTYSTDSEDVVRYGFSGVKFDSQPGGKTGNMTKWALALNATGKQLMIENCHDKERVKYLLEDPVHCPFNFYRTGDDNAPHFIGGLSHILHDTLPFLSTSVGGVQASRPG